MSTRQERMESCISVSDFKSVSTEIVENVLVEEEISPVLTNIDLDEGSDDFFFGRHIGRKKEKKENEQMWRLCPQQRKGQKPLVLHG